MVNTEKSKSDFASATRVHGFEIMPEATQPTLRTHFNPAFWVAFWNVNYFSNQVGKSPRDQRIFVLSLRGNTIFETKVEKAHVEKGLGLAPAQAQQVIEWAKQNVSETKYDDLVKALDQVEDVELCNENVFCTMERGPAYTETIQAIKDGGILTRWQKANVATFLVFQALRHPKSVRHFQHNATQLGKEIWEGSLEMRRLGGNPNWLFSQVSRLVAAHWNIHLSDEHTFPLPDDAVLVNEAGNRIWIALSPRMLLEVCLSEPARMLCNRRVFDARRDKSIYRNYRQLAIRQASTEIVSHDRASLEQWKESPEFRERLRDLSFRRPDVICPRP